MAGIYREAWEERVLTRISTADKASWLDGIEDKSAKVTGSEEAQIINYIDFCVEPEVLINNMDYPIPSQELDAKALPIMLDKLQTKVVPISDDELQGLAYDKIDAVTQSHVSSITKSKFKRSIWHFAPPKHTEATPVLTTTGEDDGTGRRRITYKDIVALKAKFDDAEIPEEGRRLVLSTDHANDILLFDNVFKEKYSNEQSGRIMNQAGFDVYTYVATPYFNAATKQRNAFGSIPNTGDYKASVAFYAPRMVKASGVLKMYYSKSENDPATQTSRMNFKHYFIAMPKKQEGIGAIVSAQVTT